MGKHNKKKEKKRIYIRLFEKNTYNKENNNDVKQIFRYLETEQIDTYAKIINILAVVLSGAYFITNYLYNLNFKMSCQSYYNIPAKYFSDSIDLKLIYLFLALLLIFTILSPILLKDKYINTDSKNKISGYVFYVIFLVLMGSMLGIINILNFATIIDYFHFNKEILNKIFQWVLININIITVVIIVSGILCLVLLAINVKYKKILNIILFFLFFIHITLFIGGIYTKLNTNISDKEKYETLLWNNKTMAILSAVDKKYLIVEYIIDENGKTILLTNNYWVSDISNSGLSYKKLGPNPSILFNYLQKVSDDVNKTIWYKFLGNIDWNLKQGVNLNGEELYNNLEISKFHSLVSELNMYDKFINKLNRNEYKNLRTAWDKLYLEMYKLYINNLESQNNNENKTDTLIKYIKDFSNESLAFSY